MAKGVPKKQKKGQPPPVDKLLKPAIGVALALIGYQFIRGLGSGVRAFHDDGLLLLLLISKFSHSQALL